jgi:hypothetical protein
MKIPDNGPSGFDIDQVREFIQRSITIRHRDNALAFSHLEKIAAALDEVLDVLHHTRNALAQAVGNRESAELARADQVLRTMKRLGK